MFVACNAHGRRFCWQEMRVLQVIVAVGIMVAGGIASAVGPYEPDEHTLHLWHLDEAGLGDRLVSSRDDERRGPVVTVRSPGSAHVVERLRARRVFVDARRDLIRIGPAPYLTNDEIDRGVRAVVEESQRAIGAA